MSSNAPKTYSYMEHVLQGVNATCIKIPSNERKKINQILHGVLDKFLKQMKATNPLFKHMKPRLEYVGSSYEGLQVGSKTDFDVSVILKLPINYDDIKLDSRDAPYDYTCIIMPSEFRRLSTIPVKIYEGFGRTEAWCDSKHRLLASKVRHWMQSVIDIAIQKLDANEKGEHFINISGGVYKISSATGRLANTISVNAKHLKCPIEIDLVPTLYFDSKTKWPINSTIETRKIALTDAQNFLVAPKPYKKDCNWRLTLPNQERDILWNKYNLKNALRIIKKIRSAQRLDGLPSYYIKTLFFWEVQERSQEEQFWNQSMAYLCMHMLVKLRDALNSKKLMNFWSPNQNLLTEKFDSDILINWAGRLTHIINDVEGNLKRKECVLLKYILNEHEMCMYSDLLAWNLKRK